MDKKPKLHIALFQDAPIGGAQRAAYGLAQALERCGVSMDIYCPREGEWAAFLKQEGAGSAPAQRRARNRRIRPTLRDIVWDVVRTRWEEKRMARKIEQGRYDLALVNPGYLGSPPLLRHLKGIPTIYYCQEPLRIAYEMDAVAISMPPWKNLRQLRASFNELHQAWVQALVRPWLRAMDRANVRSAGLLLTNSKRMQRYVEEIFQRANEVCYLGVDAQKFTPDPDGIRKPAVLSVGIGGLRKGHDLLLRAVALIPSERRPAVWIVDRALPPHQRQYLEFIASFMEVQMEIHERLSDDQLLRLYRTASVFCFAPIREPFGLVVLEAMSCGLPVVVVDEAGASEAIRHNQTGLITPRTPQALCQAIDELLTHPDKARRMAQAARASILESWTWDHAAEKFLKIWNEHGAKI